MRFDRTIEGINVLEIEVVNAASGAGTIVNPVAELIEMRGFRTLRMELNYHNTP